LHKRSIDSLPNTPIFTINEVLYDGSVRQFYALQAAKDIVLVGHRAVAGCRLRQQLAIRCIDISRVINAGNHFDSAAAFTVRFDVDVENPLQSLGPGHRCTAFGGRWVGGSLGALTLLPNAPLCGCHLHTMRAVRCKHTVKAGGFLLINLFEPYKKLVVVGFASVQSNMVEFVLFSYVCHHLLSFSFTETRSK
jgi:hypothetical protein